MTILIHKKDSTHDPVNFFPITLQSIPLKVFLSAVRNKLFVYLMSSILDLKNAFEVHHT